MTTPGRQQLHTSEAFRAEARKAGGQVLSVRKEYAATVAKADGSAGLNFTISTESPDRSADIVRADGWLLEAYRKNPVILWAHDYSVPVIGRAPTLIVEGGALKAQGAEFTPREVNPFGFMIGQLYEGGWMHAVSVGFAPRKWAWREDETQGCEYQQQELLEWSAVPVPANADALISAKSAGVDLAPLRSWAERVLDAQEPGHWMPRGEVEALRKALAPTVIQSAGVPAVPDVLKELADLREKVAGMALVMSALTGERDIEGLGKVLASEVGDAVAREIAAAWGG